MTTTNNLPALTHWTFRGTTEQLYSAKVQAMFTVRKTDVGAFPTGSRTCPDDVSASES
jgi:hypothetical protein